MPTQKNGNFCNMALQVLRQYCPDGKVCFGPEAAVRECPLHVRFRETERTRFALSEFFRVWPICDIRRSEFPQCTLGMESHFAAGSFLF